MDSETARCLFTYASAGFELAGLGFVAKEIWGARQHAKEVLGGKSGVDLKLRVGNELTAVYAIESEEKPTTWERLQRLEQEQARESREIRREIGDLATKVQSEVDRVRNEALKAAAARDGALRDLIALQEGGSIRFRLIGAICIAIGICLAVPANLFG